MTPLRVAEVFGPTAQGEGPHVGHVCAFLRLSGCNLSCSWCDTPFTWDWSKYDQATESREATPAELAGLLEAMPVERVILTGGEPMLQQQKLAPLLTMLTRPVDVETNGTVYPNPDVEALVDLFVVSPKIGPSAGQLFRHTVTRTHALERYAYLARHGKAAWKYVARDTADLDAIARHVDRFHVEHPYVMPEGRTAFDVVERTAAIADTVVARGWRLSTRLHVLAWGDERGR